MKTNLTTIIVASCVLSGVAIAGRSPSGPDFLSYRPRAADTSQAASHGRAAIDPLDVIPFAFDSSKLDPVSRIQIDEAAGWIVAHPSYRLVVAGHTDAAGGDAYNVGLSARRAKAVRDELVARGVPRARIVLALYGEANRPSHWPYAAANRVAVLYATTLPPETIGKATLAAGTAAIWEPSRAPVFAATPRRGSTDLIANLGALRNAHAR
jgi:hypothetical protein